SPARRHSPVRHTGVRWIRGCPTPAGARTGAHRRPRASRNAAPESSNAPAPPRGPRGAGAPREDALESSVASLGSQSSSCDTSCGLRVVWSCWTTIRLSVWRVLRRGSSGSVAQICCGVSWELGAAGGGGGLIRADGGAWLHSLSRAMIGVIPVGELPPRRYGY